MGGGDALGQGAAAVPDPVDPGAGWDDARIARGRWESRIHGDGRRRDGETGQREDGECDDGPLEGDGSHCLPPFGERVEGDGSPCCRGGDTRPVPLGSQSRHRRVKYLPEIDLLCFDGQPSGGARGASRGSSRGIPVAVAAA